ncbi:unnamed protein product [Rotaria sp. Silwood1]|nr:unnamed protein product [Rotaria sp. Silwood1]CAF3552939.1 unnamed protein product [Rotaria sp. Silwood1]CAF4580105.1 unnamed protein product [Rotaria sp. Silwood1]CAF4840533.1 unnamed protein product [Rotaria sp. Silwood1]
MSASAKMKKPCATCKKSGGILSCEGCQQAFCGKHVIEHRQYLAGKLDGIMQEHDLLQHDIEQISVDHSLLQKIDQWEKESLAKIHLAAKIARENIQKFLDQSKENLSKTCRDLAVNLCSSREADDYSENDFIHWIEQLKELKQEITSSSSIKIIQDKKSVIHLVKVENSNVNTNKSTNSNQMSLLTSEINLKIQEKYSDVLGPITLENGGFLAKHTGFIYQYAYTRGNLLYSHGHHTVRFQLEKCKQPYQIFFGCMSSKVVLGEGAFKYPCSVGWFGFDQVYEHGRCTNNCKKYGYKSSLIRANDVLQLIFDCDKQQIKLFNERIKKTTILTVNINKTPYPWQFLMVMFHKDDCVKILSDA